MGTDGDTAALFGECKWTNEKVDVGVLDKLIERSQLFHYAQNHYYLFAKTGFTSGCIEEAKAIPNMHLVSRFTVIIFIPYQLTLHKEGDWQIVFAKSLI